MVTQEEVFKGETAVPPTLTRKDLQVVFKVSGRTIDRLVASGQLPAPFRVGRSCRWRRLDIVGFIEAAEGRVAGRSSDV